jgi:hypothetical protein
VEALWSGALDAEALLPVLEAEGLRSINVEGRGMGSFEEEDVGGKGTAKLADVEVLAIGERGGWRG